MDAPDKSLIYSTLSLRTFADTQMGKAGLDRKWIELIIGHSNNLAASASYKDWDAIEEEWVEKCADRLQLLTVGDPEQKREIERLQSHNGKLELLLERLLGRFDKTPTW